MHESWVQPWASLIGSLTQLILLGLESPRKEIAQNDPAKVSWFLTVSLSGGAGLLRPEFLLNLKGAGVFHP